MAVAASGRFRADSQAADGWFRGLCWATAISVFAMLVLGGVVRVTESGLGCGDDWPLCDGRWLPALGNRADNRVRSPGGGLVSRGAADSGDFHRGVGALPEGTVDLLACHGGSGAGNRAGAPGSGNGYDRTIRACSDYAPGGGRADDGLLRAGAHYVVSRGNAAGVTLVGNGQDAALSSAGTGCDGERCSSCCCPGRT